MLACLLIPSLSKAQTYSYDPTAVTADTIPLANSVIEGAQYLYQASEFSPALPASGGTITTIYIKPANSDASGSTFTNLWVQMQSTSATSMSGSNWLLGLTSVLPQTTTSIAGWTANNWIAIPLATPFYWDGTSNLNVGLFQMGYTNPMLLQHGTISGANVRSFGNIYTQGTNHVDTQLMSFGFDLACGGVPDQPVISNSAWPAATPLCSGMTTTLNAAYTAGAPTTGLSFQWESASSATGPWSSVSGGSGATTLSYTTASLSTTTYYRLAVTCSNSSQTNYSLVYEVPVGSPAPGAITASAGACPGDTVSFSVPNVSGTTYAWTLPAGWIGTSTSNIIVVVPGSTSGAISVSATSACGATSIASTLTPAAGSAPATPGSIFGNSLVCGGTTETYTTLPVPGATSYIWTLPSGWTGSSTTNSITLTTGSVSGSIKVQAQTGCGASMAGTPFNVTVLSSLAAPGAITGADTVCDGSMQIYSVTPVPGATSYSWILPSGWSGTTTTNSIQTFPAAGTGTVSVTASANCASSSSASKTVVTLPAVTPSASIASSISAICQNAPVTFTATALNAGSSATYQWKKNNSPITGATAAVYTDYTLSSSDLISVDVFPTARCHSGAAVTSNSISVNVTPAVTPGINIATVPPINICMGTPVTFTASDFGGGSSPSYQWYKNGTLIPSANFITYTDAALADADTISVEMISTAACATNTLAQSNKVGVHVSDTASPTVTISVSPSDVIVSGQFLDFQATTDDAGPKQDFQWQRNGVDIPFETAATYSTNSLKAGDVITVRMQSYARCVNNSVVKSNGILLKSPVNVSAVEQIAGLKLYPNPNNGRFTIAADGLNASLIGQQLRLDVISALGQSVYHVELSPSSTNWKIQVDLGNLSAGQYMLRVSSTDGAYRSTLPFILN